MLRIRHSSVSGKNHSLQGGEFSPNATKPNHQRRWINISQLNRSSKERILAKNLGPIKFEFSFENEIVASPDSAINKHIYSYNFSLMIFQLHEP